MNTTMSTIDQTGAVEAEDVLVNGIRAIKAFAPRKRKEVSAVQIPAKKEIKDGDDPKEAYVNGYNAGVLEGKKAGYLEALQHLEIYIKSLNV